MVCEIREGSHSNPKIFNQSQEIGKESETPTELLPYESRTEDSFITTWTEMRILGVDHRRPTFPEPLVTKPVVTQGTNRYQMKDMDMIFLLIPPS